MLSSFVPAVIWVAQLGTVCRPPFSAEVWFGPKGIQMRRLFDPYTGKDIGSTMGWLYKSLSWLGKIHGNLMLGNLGTAANGVGGFLTGLLCLTGCIVWWPGVANWRRSLTVHRRTGWKRFNWDLHSSVGIWTFAFLLMWGLTGASFIFPDPFRATINFFTPINPPRPPQSTQANPQRSGAPAGLPGQGARRPRRPLTTGQKILRGFSYAHYGNFAGWRVKTLWTILGLAPALLFGTGLLMWWNRVVLPALRRLSRSNRQALEENRVEGQPVARAAE